MEICISNFLFFSGFNKSLFKPDCLPCVALLLRPKRPGAVLILKLLKKSLVGLPNMTIALSNTVMGSNCFEKHSIWQAEPLGPELQIHTLSLPPPVCFSSSLQHPSTMWSHISDGYRGGLEGCKMDLQCFRFKTFRPLQSSYIERFLTTNCRHFRVEIMQKKIFFNHQTHQIMVALL